MKPELQLKTKENGDSTEQALKHLQKIAIKLGLIEPKFRISMASEVGDNYIGIVYRVVIEGKKNGNAEKLYGILKCLLTKSSIGIEFREMFIREIFFYQVILPTFDEMLQDYGMSVRYFPKIYAANQEPDNELLFLEDLKRTNYVMSKARLLNYSHLSQAFRCIGEFHAYSFATRAKRPDLFEKLRSMEEIIFTGHRKKNKEVGDITAQLTNVVSKALDGEDSHYLERLQSFSQNFEDHMQEATDGKLAEPYAVVNHGDFWTNNILFKYKENNETCEIEDLRFLDFQLSRYSSPALDLIYILFCCVEPEIRAQYYDQLLLEYHESLSKCLERLDCDPETLFPFSKLLEQLQRFGKFAAGMACYVIHIFTDEKKQHTDIKNWSTDILYERLETDELYRRMLKATFKDLVDKNYI